MTCPQLLARLDVAEARLARVSGRIAGLGVGTLFRERRDTKDPDAVPVALYVRRADKSRRTLVYHVAADRYAFTIPDTLCEGD